MINPDMRLQTAPRPATSPRNAGSTGASTRVFGRRLLQAAAAGLAVYHAILLWDRVVSLALLEPAVALRWGAAALLCLGLARMWRAGVPLFAGREALAVWTLVVLLHAGMVPGVGGIATLAEAEAVFGLTLSLSTLLWLLGTDGTCRTPEPHRTSWRPRPATPRAFRAACLAILSPRAPPATA